MRIVISDLDGTLLDHDSYSFADAAPALARLKELGVPVVVCTSKTAAEAAEWRRQMDLDGPYVVENGGAAVIPAGQLGTADREELVLGTPYARLVEALRAAAAESGCRVEGFSDWTAEEVARECSMGLERAVLAKQRRYDEPFVVKTPEREAALLAAIQAMGLRTTRGGRFLHILGANDKATAVRLLLERYRAVYGEVRSVGLGDGLNDAEFLLAVDDAVLIRSPRLAGLQTAVPAGRATELPGPAGWNQAILERFGS